MEVSDVLKNAWMAVEQAGLPEEIHEVAFREAVRLMVPAAVAPVPAAQQTAKPASGDVGAATSSAKGSSSESGVNVSEEEMYGKVVTQTGVERAKLEQLVHIDDDGPRVSVPGLKLGKNNAERARSVAQILTITRGFGLGENETSLEVIRTECDRLKVYDSANFSSHMKALNGYVITGAGQNRRLRAKGPGIAAFGGLVDSLLGDS